MASSTKFVQALWAHIGVPYKFGGADEKGMDCSGLIHRALADVGVSFPRHSGDQIDACAPIPVDPDTMPPGTLLWRQGHDAIYLGDRRTIEALTASGVTVTTYTDTYQGKARFTRAGLIPGVDYTEGMMTVSRMVSPLAGYLTQKFKARKHLGMDIGSGGKAGAPVYAAFAGRVISVFSSAKPGNTASTWAPGRTSNGPMIQNVGPGSSGDGELQAYGHVRSIVKVGDQVQAGDLIGYLDNSGQWTGWHLHFEMWTASKVAYDPQKAFDRWGVRVGSAPTVPPVKPKPETPTPIPPNVGEPSVLAWQKRQNKYGAAGLYEDGIDGPKSQAWREWVRSAQTSLNEFKVTWPRKKLTVDSDYGSTTAAYVKDVQGRNRLYRDGIVARVMIAWMRSKGSKIQDRPQQ